MSFENTELELDLDLETIPNFSDFCKDHHRLLGDSVSIRQIVNTPIIVTGYRIGPSRYRADNFLTLQYVVPESETPKKPHVCFTSATVLIKKITEYEDKIPFRTKIIKPGKYYDFI